METCFITLAYVIYFFCFFIVYENLSLKFNYPVKRGHSLEGGALLLTSTSFTSLTVLLSWSKQGTEIIVKQ